MFGSFMESFNWFVFNVDSVYCTVCLCISDRICSLLHTCSVCFMIIKKCLLSLQANHFCWHKCCITHFLLELGVTLPISRMSQKKPWWLWLSGSRLHWDGTSDDWRALWKNQTSRYISFLCPSLSGVLFPMFCLLVGGECQILVF